MKKLLLFITLFIFLPLYAAQDDIPSGLLGPNLNITTYTSEPCGIAGEEGGVGFLGNNNQMARYKCNVSASTGFVDFISSIYKYIFFICLVLGVLFLVVMGIGISVSGVGSEELKNKAKEKIWDIFWGLFFLAMVPWILKTIAPFFFK